jgi:hypothetical protein
LQRSIATRCNALQRSTTRCNAAQHAPTQVLPNAITLHTPDGIAREACGKRSFKGKAMVCARARARVWRRLDAIRFLFEGA